MLEAFRVCETLDWLPGPDGNRNLRIELFQSTSDATRFRLRVWRHEHFRVQPTFPQDANGQPQHQSADESILVDCSYLLPPDLTEPLSAASVSTAREIVIARLSKALDIGAGS
ncbi:MAG TPA: hypothetical protein VEB21_16540 [Terriglobales bacterium]|nr:hypothetical protein [Terriglobales bacterium]